MAGSLVWFRGDNEEHRFAVQGARKVAGKGAVGFSSEIWAVDPEPGPLLSEHRQRGHCSPSPQMQMAPPIPASCWRTPPQRLRWQAHLEFTHNHDVGDLTWDKIAVSLPRSEKLRSLVLAGVPHSMRPQVRWGATEVMGTGAPRGLSAVPCPLLSCGCGCLGPCRRRGTPSCPTERS